MKVKYIILGFVWLVSLVIVANKCSRKEIETKTITKTDTIWNDTTIYSVKYIPKIYTKTDTVRIENTVILTDTIEIVKDYKKSKHYSDTLFVKNQFKLIINDVISRNNIIARNWKYTNLSPISVTSTKTIINSRHFYVTGQISTYNDFSPSFGAMYLDKKRNSFTITYDPLNKAYSFGYGYRIF